MKFRSEVTFGRDPAQVPETPNTERAGYRRGNAPLSKIASKAVLSVPNDSPRWYEHHPIGTTDDFARHKVVNFSGYYLGIYCCGLTGRQIPIQGVMNP